jgi:leucyl aminopeptidase
MLRKHKKLSLLSLGLLSSISLAVQAAPAAQTHVIVAPQCLVDKLADNYTTLSSSESLTLIETNPAGIDALITAKNQRSAIPCGGFMDVTDAWNEYHPKGLTESNRAQSFLNGYTHPKKHLLNKSSNNYSIKYQNQVNQLLKTINPQDIWTDLTHFSDTSKGQFPDRYAGSDNGVKAAQWLKTKIEDMAKANNRTDVTTWTVATGTQYKQPSVVVKIGNSNEPGVVIGGHMDTLNSSWELKPGADDDGSGSMTVMEVARTLISSGMNFKKPIYIIWYSAEEMGLVGSSYVVKDFKNKNIPVDAVLQLDMTGYANQNDPTIWLITDNVNKDLTAYLKTLVNTYVKVPVSETRCGYACSDHASWDKAGFTASFPFEAKFGNDDPYIHTAQDTMEVLSQSHMADFAKLGTAFAVELAEPTA